MRTLPWRHVVTAGILLSSAGVVLDGSALVRGVTVLGFVFVIGQNLNRNRDLASGPWRLIMMGGVFALVHSIARAVDGGMTGEEYPFPSVVEPLAFIAYGFMIAGAAQMVRLRTLERRREDFTDAAIVAFMVGMVIFNVLFAPYLHDTDVAVLDRVIVTGYVFAVLSLTGVVARLAFGAGERNAAYYLLALSAVVIITNDVLLRGFTAGWGWGLDTARMLAPLAFVFAAGAVSHPGVSKLTDRPAFDTRPVGRRRLLPLVGAIVMGPALLVAAEFGLFEISRIGTICGTALLSLLVLLRMVDLVRSKESSIDDERTLRGAATSLATATDRDAVLRTTLEACLGITCDQFSSRASLYRVVGPMLGLEMSRGVYQHSAARSIEDAAIVELGTHGEVGWVATYEEVAAFDRAGEHGAFQAVFALDDDNGGRFVCVVTQPQVFGRQQVASLESFATQVSLALESVQLRESMHLQRSNQRFQALVESGSDVVMVLSPEDRETVTFVSAAVRHLLGRADEDVLGRSVLDLVHRPDQQGFVRLLRNPSTRSDLSHTAEARLLHGSGELRWFQVDARDLTDDHEVQGIVLTASDVSARKRAEAQLLRSESRFRLLVQHSSDAIVILDDDSVVTYASPSIETLMGFSAPDVLGRNVFEVLSVGDAERLRDVEPGTFDGHTIEVRAQTFSGEMKNLEVSIRNMRDQPEIDGVLLNIRDVTERKSLEADLEHQSLHDDLTGLANRAFFTQRIDEAIRSPKRDGEIIAVLFIDLDDFKLINDSLGHVIGDQVLVSVADRIQQALRLSDVAARLGGDEFAVLLSGVYGASEVAEVADRILTALQVPVHVDGQELPLSASIGVASDLDASRTGNDLLRTADVAMNEAKRAGKSRIELFEDRMEASLFAELEMKTSLAQAIENDELVLHYQPLIDLASGKIRGVEALIRWEDPSRGMISPALFIPVAEETGLIKDIGIWVVHKAASDLARWREMGFDLYCSVNVSGRQLDDEFFADRFIEAVHAGGVDGTAIVVELTESVLANDGVPEVFDRLHEEGFRIALDDFGTGYSSFQYLQSFDIDLIKIDRSFVSALGTDQDAGVVEAVLDVASRVGATTVAEGIEETSQARLLRQMGVNMGQGYYFARPLPEDKLIKYLEDELVGDMPSRPASV